MANFNEDVVKLTFQNSENCENQLDLLHESDSWKSADNDNEVLETLFALACPQKASKEFKDPPLKMFFHLVPKITTI